MEMGLARCFGGGELGSWCCKISLGYEMRRKDGALARAVLAKLTYDALFCIDMPMLAVTMHRAQ
jgi:predicted metal-binding transcription factor (methanogenesis marker protein 9)